MTETMNDEVQELKETVDRLKETVEKLEDIVGLLALDTRRTVTQSTDKYVTVLWTQGAKTFKTRLRSPEQCLVRVPER